MKKKLDTKLGHSGTHDMRSPHLVKNNGVFYYRRRIPEHLLPAFHPKTQIKFSLKTKIESDARIKASEAETHYLKQFKEAEKRLAKVKHLSGESLPETLVPFSLTDETQDALAKKYLYEEILSEDNLHNYLFNTPGIDINPGDYDFFPQADDPYFATAGWRIAHILEGESGEHKRLAISTYKEIDVYYDWAMILCNKQNIDFHKLSDLEKRNLTRRYLIEERKLAFELQSRQKGEFRTAHEVVNKDEIYQIPTTTWADVFKYWEDESDSRAKSVAAYKAEFDSFRKFLKNKPIQKVTYQDATDYKTYINKLDLTTKTKNKKISFLKTIFSKAFRNRLLEINALDIDLLKDKSSDIKRIPFSNDDLQRIFNSDIYLKGIRPEGGGGEASFWVPAIAYYTGARLEEICQLRKVNIKHSDTSGYYFEILNIDEDGNQITELKNKNSVRNVPIHNNLLSMGFLDYVRTVKDEFIFSELSLRENSKQRSVNFTKWFMRHLRTNIGITSRLKVFHSFRHNFYALCDNADVTDGVRDDLVGHKKINRTSRSYKGQRALETLRQAMDKIKPEIVIPNWTA